MDVPFGYGIVLCEDALCAGDDLGSGVCLVEVLGQEVDHLTDGDFVDVLPIFHQQLFERKIAAAEVLFDGSDELHDVDRFEVKIADELCVGADGLVVRGVPVGGEVFQDVCQVFLDGLSLQGFLACRSCPLKC